MPKNLRMGAYKNKNKTLGNPLLPRDRGEKVADRPDEGV